MFTRSAPFVLILVTALAGGPARAQTQPLSPPTTSPLIHKADVKKFGAYRATDGYLRTMLRAAIQHDRLLPPPCAQQKPLRFLLVKLVRPIRFKEGNPAPTSGVWVERVQMQRCGKTVLHSVYVRAGRAGSSLRVVSTLPGDTITDVRFGLDFQTTVSRAVLAADAKQRKPACAKRLITNTKLVTVPAAKIEPWAESWTVHGCDTFHEYDVTITPHAGAVPTFTVYPKL